MAWLKYFKAEAWPEMNERILDEVHEDEVLDYLWDEELRHFAAFKARQGKLSTMNEEEKRSKNG